VKGEGEGDEEVKKEEGTSKRDRSRNATTTGKRIVRDRRKSKGKARVDGPEEIGNHDRGVLLELQLPGSLVQLRARLVEEDGDSELCLAEKELDE
jgi:hypothetical protein